MEPRIRVNDIFESKVNDVMEAKDMADNGSVFAGVNGVKVVEDPEESVFTKYNTPKTSIAWSSYKPVIRKEFYEDMGYLVEDFAKLKAQIMSNNLSDEIMAILLDNFGEKLQRFQKRYGNTENYENK